MKSLKLLAAGLLVAASVSVASATTTIRISGSTAFRKAVVASVKNVLKTGYTWGSVTTGTAASIGDSQVIFAGQLNNATADDVVIKLSWRGSESGIYALVTSTGDAANAFIADSAVSSLSSGGAALASTVATDYAQSDIAFSDTFVASSLYKSKASSITDSQVGIIPFIWVAAYGDNAAITGLTTQLAKIALSGNATLNLWTGNWATDASTPVYVVGRDEDSGTRLTAFLESSYGATTAPQQYQPVGAAGGYTGLQLWPINTVNSVTYPAGHSGFSGGGSLQAALNDTTLTLTADVISYLGQGDATNALKSATPVKPLTWNGVQFVSSYSTSGVSWNTAVLFNGQYTFWGYEHALILKSTSSTSAPGRLYTLLKSELASGTEITDNSAGYKISQMHVARDGDGGPVYTN